MHTERNLRHWVDHGLFSAISKLVPDLLTQAEGSQGELIGWDSSQCPFTLSNMNISETSESITIKFYMKYHFGGGTAAKGLGADQIRTLVSVTTDSSTMEKTVSSRFLH